MNNRPIKLRFWDKESSHWRELPDLYGDYQASAFRTYGDGFEIKHFLSGEAQEKIRDGILIIQQFTGLKDSTGKEIYEGDIVSFRMPFSDNRKQKIGEIKYGQFSSSHEAGYSRGHIHVGFYPETNGETLYDFDDEDVDWKLSTVIGNIFENPELLA